tara:strand:- start:1038 stop:2489 length:1452 start_codon:yes stop_codon:yes gene_type:complete
MIEVDKELYTLNNNDDERKLFINMKNYEEYIIKLGIHHILSKIQESTILTKGFIKDSSYYNNGEKIHFTIVKHDKYEFIEKIDKSDHLYSQFDENYTIDGKITKITPKQDEKYPKLSKVEVEVQLIDQIAFVLSDPIMVDSHKKLRLYELLEPHIDGLFHLLKEKDYQKYELDQFITLCNTKNQLCNYPCSQTDDGCKLYVREKDSNGNLLIERIKWKFIEKLIIFGIDNKEKIIEEKVSIHELMNSTNFHEIFYTFSEYKNDILNEIFTKSSKYIMDITKANIIKKRNMVMKKLDSIPYYIQKLFGKGSSVVFNLTENNNDFLTLEKAFLEAGIPFNAETIQKLLISELELNDTKSFLEKYPKKYANMEELIEEVKSGNYRIQNQDFELILRGLSDKDINLGILLLSSKNNPQKKNTVYFYSSGLDIMDIESVPIIPVYHTYYNEEYILSNILVNYAEELNYYTTIGDLYAINPLHKKWIKI